MTRNDYVFAGLLGIAYVVLISVLGGVSATWGDFISSDDFWRQSNAAAITYVQIYHSIGVVLAAVPISLAIAWRHKADWVRPATVIAVVGSFYMLFDQARAAWYLSQHDLAIETYFMVSGAIDIVKVGLILFVVTAILKRIFVRIRAPV